MHNESMWFSVLSSALRLVGLIGLLGSGVAMGNEVGTASIPLRLVYQERPPYTAQRPGGGVEGLVASPISQALTRAGVVFRWELTPSQRQLLLVQTGQEPVCAVGWFRNPEREKLGRFSRPVYRDLPMGALVRADVPLADGVALATTLASGKQTVLTKEGFSYGAEVDQWLSTPGVRRVSTGSEPLQLVRMLLASRADMLLVAGASATVDRRDVGPSGVVAAGGQIVHFGMPVDPGNLLFIGSLNGVPVVGLPGCARSPALNGADWVLERLACGLAVTAEDIAAAVPNLCRCGVYPRLVRAIQRAGRVMRRLETISAAPAPGLTPEDAARTVPAMRGE